jgi:hypothetical protein
VSYIPLVAATTCGAALACEAEMTEKPPSAKADAATSAMRLKLVFVDIIFLSIVEDWTIQFPALR